MLTISYAWFIYFDVRNNTHAALKLLRLLPGSFLFPFIIFTYIIGILQAIKNLVFIEKIYLFLIFKAKKFALSNRKSKFYMLCFCGVEIL